ncbi:fluoride efflux transporter CrcB [Kineobactrum sediminis]|uniref:Fluoride-specific ion channel FluC n=1 Tax=Kineobactrum sediminis TaxID=1905677 RepID=A0A2N5Y362_9GAMM|nr:fluoride efflux transporter CrcB [Kineobactrum sediminis]PLW82831.1 fluoride efflux transporter CrcB [Kineobactrum sediminis]
MKYLLFIALGGAAGSVARYSLSLWTQSVWHSVFPVATLLINITGSFAIGVVFVLLERHLLHPDWRSILAVGFLGAFTTFSTFSLEVVTLWESGQATQALIYMAASMGLCVLGAGAGIALTRTLA